MRHWLLKITQNRDFLNTGDTRMVCCELSEQCSKNRSGYKEFISSLEWEVIENKKSFFEQIDIDKQKIIIKKLIHALDAPSLWLQDGFSEKDLDELMLLQTKCGLAETLEGMKPYFDRFYEMAIQHFTKELPNGSSELQDAIDVIQAEHLIDQDSDYYIRKSRDNQLDRLAYGSY